MSASAEASVLICACAEPVRAGESIKALIRKAARRAGIPQGRARSLWYAEARAVRAEEMDCLRKAARGGGAEDYATERAELRTRLAEQAERLDRIERLLASIAGADRPLV